MVPDKNGHRPPAVLSSATPIARRPQRRLPTGGRLPRPLSLLLLLTLSPVASTSTAGQPKPTPVHDPVPTRLTTPPPSTTPPSTTQSTTPPPSITPPPTTFFRYQRQVSLASTGPACALFDADIYPHAAPFLKDLRLYESSGPVTYELPYVLTLSEPQQVDTEYARVLNLSLHGRSVVFDLAMPDRDYTDVVLDLDAHNFLATATVTAPTSSQDTSTARSLGTFTLYDLSARHLSRGTTLHLQETHAPLLHVTLSIAAARGMAPLKLSPRIVQGAEVPPSREAQTLFTPSARPGSLFQRGSETVATFNLPERVPVERVLIVLAPGFSGNFSREVHLIARSIGAPGPGSDNRELVSGTIRRMRLTESGREIREQQLGIPAVLGANLQHPATVEVAIENGDQPPLPVSSVLLEMRERKLCFEAPSTTGITLFYGDPGLSAPRYDYAHSYVPGRGPENARLGPEEVVASFHPRPDLRPVTARHPHLLWIALLVSVCSLALAASRSRPTHPRRR